MPRAGRVSRRRSTAAGGRPRRGPRGPGRRRRGRCQSPSARPFWPSCTPSASSTARPRRSGRRCSTRAATWRLSARCTGCWPPSTARSRERRDQLRHPSYAAPELLAERPNEVYSWDITKLKGPATWTYFYLYVILDVFSRYAVGWTVQHREDSLVAKDLIAQVCEQQHITPRPADGARRPRQLDDQQARRVPARRSRRAQDAQPALHLDRQPLQRSAVQDAEVPARLPRSGSTRSSTPERSAASSSPGTTTNTATPASAS